MATGKDLTYWRALCDQSFFHFVRIVGGSVNQGAMITKWIHGPLATFSQSDHKRKAICTPRDWLKSTMFTKWKTIWDYLQAPEERQLIASENEKLAGRMLYWIEQQFLRNKRLRELYADKLSYVDDAGELRLLDSTWTKKNRWNRTECDLPRQGIYSEPAISAIGIRGAAQSGHYTTIHIDDIVGEAAMESELVMEDVRRWFDNCYELLVEPDWELPGSSKIEIVGTHWGLGDFFCYVQEKYKEFAWRIVPCRKDTSLIDKEDPIIKYVQHPTQGEGETNWPNSPFTTEYYTKMAANPEKTLIYWAQHMNNPQKASGLNTFDAEWIRYYKKEKRDEGWYFITTEVVDGEEKEEEYAASKMQLRGMIDPGGFSLKKGIRKGSRLAIIIGGQPKGTNKKFIVYQWAGKFKDPNQFMDIIFSAHAEWKPRVWRIDTAGTQPYIYFDIMQERKNRNTHLPISPIPPDHSDRSKETDIESLITPMANGEFWLHESMIDLRDEIKNYPQGSTRDLLDMMAKWFKIYLTRGKSYDTQKDRLKEHQRKASRDKVTGY